MNVNDNIYFATRIKKSNGFNYIVKKGKIYRIDKDFWHYPKIGIQYDNNKTTFKFEKYVFKDKNECEEFCKFSNKRLIIQRECKANVENLRKKGIEI